MSDKGITTDKSISSGQASFLILFPLILIILMGALNNNLISSGISGTPTLTCDQTLYGCYNTASLGCQSNPSSCSFVSQTFSFLNQASPFTELMQGNVFALSNLLNSRNNGPQVNHGPFDQVGAGQYFTVNCFYTNLNGGNNYISDAFANKIKNCIETNLDSSNMTKAQASASSKFANWNTNQFASSPKYATFYNIGTNATYTLGCQTLGAWWFSQTGTAPTGYVSYGCDYGAGSWPTANPTTNPRWAFIISLPATVNQTLATDPFHGIVPHPTGHIIGFVQPEAWEVELCPAALGAASDYSGRQYQVYNSQQCTSAANWYANLLSNNASYFNVGLLTPLFTFLIGLILVVVGLGIGVTAQGSILGSGTGFGLFSNPQGTKLAQVVGLGLVVWSVIYSEFGTWITSAYLPFGLDVIIGFGLTGCFFFGLYERM